MNMLKKGHPVPLLLFILSLSVLLSACGADSPTGTTVQTQVVSAVTSSPAGIDTCMSCHVSQTSAWMNTKHANLDSIPSLTNNTFCAGCHDKLGDNAAFTPARMVVSCEACHGGGADHVAKGGVGPIGFAAYTAGVISGTVSTIAVSAQFATCTGCHQLLSPTNPASAATTTAVHDAGGADPRVVTQGVSSNINSITDTHYAQSPYTSTTSTGSLPTGFPAGAIAVKGYAMDYFDANGTYVTDYTSTTVCTDCHNPHGTATINRDWAQSAHANRYGASTQYFAAAWARTNWTYSSTSVVCQRCHTTSGMKNYISALLAGDEMRADGIRHGLIVSIPKTTLWKPELLMCTGCHTDNKGTIRNPGAVTADYDYVSSGFTYAKASFPYQDISSSNVCLLCHTARESGDTLKALNDASLLSAGTISAFDFSNNSLITSHYLTGGGTVFRATGYTFSGRDYSNPASYIHDKIGTSAVPNSGTSGPCVGCHMSRPNKNGNHLFMPVTRLTLTLPDAFSRASATITGIASQVCWNCHDKNEELLLLQIEDQKVLFEESLAALANQLDRRGLYISNGGFYIQRDGSVIRPGIATATNSSAIITAVTDTRWGGTAWWKGVDPGDGLRIDRDGTLYTISSSTTTTSLTSSVTSTFTLSGPFGGANITGEYAIEKAETVSIATSGGVSTVTGVGTNWGSTGTGVRRGSATGRYQEDWFRMDADGTWYRIIGATNTTLTLYPAYTGSVTTGKYTIVGPSVKYWFSPPSDENLAGDTGNSAAKNTMGAAFNMALLEGEPAGYVHNRYYVKRLIYDSIDWIDDYQMNYSTGVSLNAACSGGYLPACEAMKYILVGQQPNPYSNSERP